MQANRYKILIVEDDRDILFILTTILEEQGYSLVSVSTEKEAYEQIQKEPLDLVVLDLGLPDGDGFGLAKFVGNLKNTGLLIVSGRSTVVDRVVGLEIGADDYVTKPFDNREFLARVRSVLRRQSQARDGDENLSPSEISEIRFSGWRLIMSTHELHSPTDTIVHLTNNEFKLFALLAKKSGTAISRDELKKELVGADWTPDDRSVDTTISRIRKKVEYDPSRPRFIASVRGVGYRFVPEATYSRGRPMGFG
jgi:DNA-binding response OmpR family regulator